MYATHQLKQKLLFSIILLFIIDFSAHSKNILLYWNAVTNAVKYEITYKINDSLEVTRFTTHTNIIIPDINYNSKYNIRIKSIGLTESSNFSNPITIDATQCMYTNKINTPNIKYKFVK